MADGPGEDRFDALRASREEARAQAAEPLPGGQAGGKGRWRLAAAGLLLVGLVAGAVALMPALRERAMPGAVAPGSETLPAAPPPPAADALALRIGELEARLEALQASPPAAAAGGAPADPGAAALSARLAALEAETRRLAEAEAGLAGRLEALAADMTAAGVTSGAVASATSEVRDIFLVLSLRRLLDGGRPLGAFDPLLRQQFETREPSAVAALVAWSSAPVGRAGLAERLAALDTARPAGGAAAPASAASGFWARLWQRIAAVVEVRTGAEEEAAPLVRARARMAEGDLPAAIALVATAPETPERRGWLEDARRLQAAEDALDRLELLVVQAATGPATG